MTDACCPKCGCNDFSRIAGGDLWGKPGFQCACNYCGCRFQATNIEADSHVAPYAVKFSVPICPHCGSKRTRVASTRRKAGEPTVRYHRCADCEKPFKSVEAA